VSAAPTISAARKSAFAILLELERGRAHADELLRAPAVSALAPADRNLATALVLGTLRWQILIDEQLKAFLKRPNAKLDAEVRIALRLGAFQLRFLDRIPAHAAIGESVELAKRAGHHFAARMVNAVLRKLNGAAPRADALGKNSEELALSQAHPSWLVERWAKSYGLEAARAICRHGQTQPPLAVRIESAAVESELTAAGVELAPGALLAAVRVVVGGDVAATDAFRENRLRIQDEGSQLVGELAAHVFCDSDKKAAKILDACAAPGGKTLILAERNPEASIVACDVSSKRLDQLKERLANFAERIEFRLADASEIEENSAFDLALVDAPCSGTGTLGRNPEIRHRLQPEDLERQAARQRTILGAALRAVRVGGRVVYSTCSLEPEENEQTIAAVLAENADARQISFAPAIESLRQAGILTDDGAVRLESSLTAEGALRLLPGIVPTDGFFVALLERAGSSTSPRSA
jgi:16S rRNA (cytosine967-C5)-methyltransferase